MFTQVRDIYAAAYIVAKGVRMDHVEEAGDGFVNFFFPAREVGPYITEWYDPDATVNIHEYLEALKQLRNITKGRNRRY